MNYRLIISLITCWLALAVPAQAQSLTNKYTEERPVVIVCDWDKPPYEFLNDRGEPAGSNIDIIKAVMKELGLPCKFVMKEWSIALRTFARGNADIILANARRYRLDDYAVSENIVNYNRICVAMVGDSTNMITMKQLEREGAVFKPSDYSAQYFKDGDSLSISSIEFQTPKVALMGVSNGDYKYFVWGEEPLKWKIKELNLQNISLNDVGIPISEIHFVGRDRQLIEEVDDQFSRLKQSGEVATIQSRWMHPERAESGSTPLAVLIIVVTLLCAALIYGLSRLTKAHVKVATRHFSELNDMMVKALHMGNFKIMEYDIANDRMTNHYGNILPENGMTLAEFTSKIHPDQREEFTEKMRLLMSGRERRFELDKRWNAGSDEAPQWLNFNGHAISEKGLDGRPAYIINAIHDVTREVEEDQAACELVVKYERLANIPFMGLAFYDKDGWLIDINDSMKRIFGFSDDSTESRRHWESMNMFDTDLLHNVYQSDDRDDLIVCRHLVNPDMNIDRFIEFSVTPLFDMEGEIANYLISAFDITNDRNYDHGMHQMNHERKDLKQNIAWQKLRLAYLLEKSTRFLIHTDIARQEIAVFRSPDEPEYVHSFGKFLDMLSPSEREDMARLLADNISSGTHEQIVHLVRRPDNGPETVLHITFHPVTDDGGHIVGREGIAVNITVVDMARRNLAEKTREANESVSRKSGFMASMTHELRTPLNAIVGFTTVIEALGDSPERAEYVRIIRNSSDMLQRLINDIIEASNISEGIAMPVKPQKVDFAEAFEEICLTLQQRVQSPTVQFWKENPYQHLYTTVDTSRIHQILTNFVTNAVKFTTEGHIHVGYRYEKHGLHLYCEDTGKGIPKDKQTAIFRRFVKLDEFVQGTGMGLAICKSIAESCGGTIGVKSDGPDTGSTFWVWIPCERQLT